MQLTEAQAFDVMRRFLEEYGRRTHSADIASLLGDINYATTPRHTADPAMWNDWMRCVNAILSRDEVLDRMDRDSGSPSDT